MPKKKTTKTKEIKEVKETPEVIIEKEELKDEYSVYNNLNQFVRKYTKEIHGERRLELAKEYVETNGGTVV
jgi:hypothetical protein